MLYIVKNIFRYLTEQDVANHLTGIEYMGRTTDTYGAMMVRSIHHFIVLISILM